MMERQSAQQMFMVQERALRDPGYLALLEEYREQSAMLIQLLESLPPKDAAVIEDYLGLTAQMHRRLLEFACK